MFSNMKISTRNLLFTVLNTMLIGAVLILASFVIQGQVLIEMLEKDTRALLQSQSVHVSAEDIDEAVRNPDLNASIQKKLTEGLDQISKEHPQIKQAYVFGVELKEGNQTSIIAQPTPIHEFMKSEGIKLGDMLPQPDVIVKGVRNLVTAKQDTITSIYDDELGTWISALHPIMDNSGNVVAYFGMDVDASMVTNGQDALLLNSSILLFFLLLINVVFQYLIVNRTFKPIQELMRGINEMSRGNLDVRLREGKDELGQVNNKFNQMAENMRTIMMTIRESSNQLVKNSQQLHTIMEENNQHATTITDNIQEMFQHTNLQNIATTECVKSLDEMVVSVESIANNSTEVHHTSLNMKDQAESGQYSVTKVADQMQLIQHSVEESENIIDVLQSQSGKIGEIVKMISEIANQTNLLALNAAIEAQRAGEHGRGFSVVADEVRKLAEQSKQSAEEISQLIKEIQERTNTAVISIRQGSAHVLDGVKIVQETGEIFRHMVQASTEVSDRMQEVSASTQQMAAETEEVTSVVKQVSENARKNTKSAENIQVKSDNQLASYQEILVSVDGLSKIAQELDSALSQLKLEEHK
ncbi:methyl-accepting chemotaxis protein [Brevibacillus laterosporus]|nr:methyl-accepting chemotaxis protein [Brevibacillus laterosporus]MDF9414275.1 methyl-accepting chemotaxis protein [Brevibacillus laterosporus]PCN42635.1 chemotaxis protein [Brevibacillus laterosporus]